MVTVTKLEGHGVARALHIQDPRAGLDAFLVLDDLTLGPAAGGIRTLAYPSAQDALEDAMRLARAMTIKCAVAGLDVGGGKAVVMARPTLDRELAFATLGRVIQDLGGAFRTGGDVGTGGSDLRVMALHTEYVHVDESVLGDAVARGLVACMGAACRHGGLGELPAWSVAIQGCGTIGSALARMLASAGARIFVADLDEDRATGVARSTGAVVVAPDDIVEMPCDIFSPCALGGVITVEVANRLQAGVVCGGANNVLADGDAETALADRGILFVPDTLASAGAAIEGIGRTVMGLPDRGPLIDALGPRTREVLDRAAREGRRATDVVEAIARGRIASAVGQGPSEP